MELFISSLFNFLVVVFVIWKFARKPAGQFMAARSEDISSQLSEAKKMSDEANQILFKAEESWNRRQEQVATQLEESKKLIQKFRENVVTGAKSQADRIIIEGKQLSLAEYSAVKTRLNREVVETAIQMASAFLRQSLSEADKGRLVVQYVDNLNHVKTG